MRLASVLTPQGPRACLWRDGRYVDLAASDKLDPPWPDLVLTIGRRMAMAALWIKSQSPGIRLALIGPPKSEVDKFDLIVLPLHYRSEERPNICRIGLPHKICSGTHAHWASRPFIKAR